MHIASVGIGFGQDNVSLGCIGRAQQGAAGQEVLTCTTAGLHCEPTIIVNRSGGMCRIALFGVRAARARTPSATDSGTVCETLSEIQ